MMRKPGTFKDRLRDVSPDDKKTIVEVHVRAALAGDINSIDFILRHSGEGALAAKPIKIVRSDKCDKCGKKAGAKPEWIDAT